MHGRAETGRSATRNVAVSRTDIATLPTTIQLIAQQTPMVEEVETAKTMRGVLRTGAMKREARLGFHHFVIHLEQRIDEKINRAAGRRRIDNEIAAFR